MFVDNVIPTFEEVVQADREDSDKDQEPPYSVCLARVYNEKYSVTLGMWHNGLGRCYEVGLRHLFWGSFCLDKQASLRICYTRFVRLAKLIQANHLYTNRHTKDLG